MHRKRSASRRRSPVGILLLMAVCATALLAGAAPAGASSPSPGATILRVGWTQEPDNLNPFIGYANTTFEFYVLQY